MSKIKLPYVFVIGNEKGGAGKTTCAMHLITGLLDSGLRVASIDSDCRQGSLTRYIENRRSYNQKNPSHIVPESRHFLLKESAAGDLSSKEKEESEDFVRILSDAASDVDVIVIDTPGSHTFLSRLAHSHADTVVTPINDSFLDIDVMARVNADDMSIIGPSIYSQMLWDQKMARAKRDGGSINWVVMRNRLSNLDAANKRSVASVLEQLSKRISFTVAPGFSERVIFRELFLQGLTLHDLTKANYGKSFSLSHVAARQELRDFLACLNIEEILSVATSARDK
ncbi:MAG: AAA family ATPase [Rickettsiaceae bacterium]|nr:AAA family ATPase [Rickettsiaceae bacterium]